MSTAASKTAGIGLLLLFGLFWNGIVAVFDVVLVRQSLAARYARQHFVEVPALVLESRVDSSYDSDGGTTYRPAVGYQYEFEGRRYGGDRYAYTAFGTSDRSWAEGVVQRFPAGAETVAYVDPDQPGESVLDPSAEAFPAFVLIFLTPFHCIGIGILVGCFVGFLRRRESLEDQRRREFVVVDDDAHFVLRRSAPNAPAVFLATLGLTSFAAIFLMAFTLGFGGASGIAFPVWCALVALAAGVAVWTRIRSKAPNNFLHIDRERGLFAFPADALGERIDRVERIELRSSPTKVSVNDVPILSHVFEAVVDGQSHEIFRRNGGEEEGRYLKALLEDAFSLPSSECDVDPRQWDDRRMSA
ncbi:MAG: DUF3592 domain-containing protein [Planctomycetota bacterium]